MVQCVQKDGIILDSHSITVHESKIHYHVDVAI